MVEVETNKQVYMFYQSPYQYNSECLKAFKAHLKVTEAQNGVFEYHQRLAAATLLENYNINWDTVIEENNIESNINARLK